MVALENRRYGISEVCRLVDVPAHTLRQWESRFPQLKPKRDRANRRYYTPADINVIRRIKQLLRHEGMTTRGASRALSQELYGQGRPKTRQEAIDLLDEIEAEVRALLDLLDEE
ncbi:MAG TPA: MerR family transcriptional regulator [Candidatus Hydrogenedentes bacterium]|nr:MerR family transcriptional regulator [Candidatus Hydrogenedentota bacterium]HIJ74898.1 MerR family transcriptional regulator [Candidatus Hydrogenedentota bacterium]